MSASIDTAATAAQGWALHPEPGAPHRAAIRSHRLPGRILSAFHQACDQGEYGVAAALLRTAERSIGRHAAQPAAEADRRRDLEALVAAHERLWLLRRRIG